MKNLKKRALSWLLALALVLGMVPATVLPKAEALEVTLTMESVKHEGDGKWYFDITVTGTPGAQSDNWVLAIVPNVESTNNLTPADALTPEVGLIGLSTQIQAALRTVLTGAVQLPGDAIYMTGNETESGRVIELDSTNGTYAFSIPQSVFDFGALRTALKGYKTADGAIIDDETTEIPMIALLYTRTDPPTWKTATAVFAEPEPPKTANLQAEGITITIKKTSESAYEIVDNKVSTTITNEGDGAATLGDITASDFPTIADSNNEYNPLDLDTVATGTLSGNTSTIPGKDPEGTNDNTATLTFGWNAYYGWDRYVVGDTVGSSSGNLTLTYYHPDDTDKQDPQHLIVPVTIILQDSASMTPNPDELTFIGTLPVDGVEDYDKASDTVALTIDWAGVAEEDQWLQIAAADFDGSNPNGWTVQWLKDGRDWSFVAGSNDGDMYMSGEGALTLVFTPPTTGITEAKTYTETYTIRYFEPANYSYSNATITLNAIINEVPPVYTVTYYPNGATSGSTYTDSSAVTIKNYNDATLNYSKTDYAFVGWNTDPNGTGTPYTAGAKVTENLELYAQWKKIHTITFVGGGADGGSMSNQTAVDGGSVTLDPNGFTYTKHDFSGWKDGDSNTYADEALIYPVTKDMTLTAQWTEQVVTGDATVELWINDVLSPEWDVSLDTDGDGNGDVTLDDSNSDGVYTASGVPEGKHTIYIYSTDSTGEKVTVAEEGSEPAKLYYYELVVDEGTGAVSDSAAATLTSGDELYDSTGYFKKDSVITLSVDPDTTDKYSNTEVTWDIDINTADDYTDPDNTVASEIDGDTLTLRDRIIAIANYAPTFDVAFVVGSGATGGPAGQTGMLADAAISLSDEPVRAGYEFSGWTVSHSVVGTPGVTAIGKDVDSTDINTLYLADGTITLPAAGTIVTFTAKWEPLAITMGDGSVGAVYGTDMTGTSVTLDLTGYITGHLVSIATDTKEGVTLSYSGAGGVFNLTGQPRTTDDIVFDITVNGGTSATDTAQLTVNVEKATPEFTVAGDSTKKPHVVGETTANEVAISFKAPYWDSTANDGAGDWTDVVLNTSTVSSVVAINYNYANVTAGVKYKATITGYTGPEGKTPTYESVWAKPFSEFELETEENTYKAALEHDTDLNSSDDYDLGNSSTYAGSLVYGYTSVPTTPVKVRVVNTGNTTLTGLKIEKANASDKYTLGALSATSIDPSGTPATFTITPQTGLTAGSHDFVVNVTADNDVSLTYTLTVVVDHDKYPLSLSKPTAPSVYNGNDGTFTIDKYDATLTYMIKGETGDYSKVTDVTAGGVVTVPAPGKYTVYIDSQDESIYDSDEVEIEVPNGDLYTATVTVLLDGGVDYDDKVTKVELDNGSGKTHTITTDPGDGEWDFTGSTAASVAAGDYTVYVTVTQPDGSGSTKTDRIDTGEIINITTDAGDSATVNLYTVNFAGVEVNNYGYKLTSEMIDPSDDKDGSTATAIPTVEAKVGGTEAISTGHIVLSGTSVTFTLSSDAMTTWSSKDYHLDWTNKGDSTELEGTVADIPYDKDYAGYVLEYKDVYGTITATLDLNRYTVTVNHKANHVVDVTLTDEEGNEFSKDVSKDSVKTEITLVPKGTYTVTSTENDTPEQDVSILGYNTTATTDTEPGASSPEHTATDAAKTAIVTVDGSPDAFAIVSRAAEYYIQITDVYPVTGDSDYSPDNTDREADFGNVEYGYAAEVTKTVTIKNTGNTTLYNVKVTVADGDFTVTLTDSSKTTLVKDDTITFTVTFPTGKSANATGESYTGKIAITAEISDDEKVDLAPLDPVGAEGENKDSTVYYLPEITVAPHPLDKDGNALTIREVNGANNQATVIEPNDQLDFETAKLKGVDYAHDSADHNITDIGELNKVQYKWVWSYNETADVSTWRDATTLADIPTKAGSSIAYTVKNDGTDEGKYFRLVFVGVKGTNYSEDIYSPYLGPVAYTATVTVEVNNVAVKTDTEAAPYSVALRPEGGDGASDIPLSFDDTAGKFVLNANTYLEVGKKYNVVVKTVANGSDTTVLTGTDHTIFFTDNEDKKTTATVDYYKVDFVDKVDEVHSFAWSDTTASTAYDVTASADYDGTGGLNAVDITTSGTPVLSGTTVTFTAGRGSEDYALSWEPKDTDKNPADDILEVTYEGIIGTVKATLTQRNYPVEGTVKQTSGKGTISHVVSVTFTAVKEDGGTIGTAPVDMANDFDTTTGIFSILLPGGFDYTFAGAIHNDHKDETVIEQHKISATDATPGTATVSAKFQVTVGKEEGYEGLEIILDGASYSFTVSDGDTDEGTDPKSEGWNAVYGYTSLTPTSKTVTITNTGNRPIKVTVTAKAGDAGDAFAAVTVKEVLVKPGLTATFDVTPQTGKVVNTYTTTYAVTATDENGVERDGLKDSATSYVATLDVDKALITKAAVTDLVTGGKGNDKAVADGEGPVNTDEPLTVTDPDVYWAPGLVSGAFKPGAVHTATVTLVPDSNHYFGDPADTKVDYTILGFENGGSDADGKAEVKKEGDNLVLIYTYPLTDPEVEATLTATSYDKATATADVDVGDGVTATVYYALIPTADVPTNPNDITVDLIKSGTSDSWVRKTATVGGNGADYEVEFDDLDPHTDYTLYAVAVAVSGEENTEALSAAATDITFYMVTVKVQDDPADQTSIGDVKAAGGNAADTVTVGVNDDPNDLDGKEASLAIEAVTVDTAYQFDKGWSLAVDTDVTGASGTTGTVTNNNADGSSATWKPDETGTASAIVITATWEPVEFEASPVAIEATYATPYNSGDPRVTLTKPDSLDSATFTYAIVGDNYGFVIDKDSGVVTGKPTTTTAAYKRANSDADIKLTVDVTCSNGHVERVEIPVTIKKLTVTPAASYDHTGGPFYQGNSVPNTGSGIGITGTVTADHWTGSTWDGSHTITGTWYFGKAPTKGTSAKLDSSRDTEDVNFQMTSTDDQDLYEMVDTTVFIDATAKSYKFELVDQTWVTGSNEVYPNGNLGPGTYIDGGSKIVTFKIRNTGNQTLTFDPSDFVLGKNNDVDTTKDSEFDGPAIDPSETTLITVAPGEVTEITFTMKVDNDKGLTVGTYTDKLTVTANEKDDGKDVTASLTLTYTVNRKPIPTAEIAGLIAPVAGNNTVTTGLTGDKVGPGPDDLKNDVYTISDVTWKDGKDNAVSAFQAGVTYVATVTLKAGTNYYFVASDKDDGTGNYKITDDASNANAAVKVERPDDTTVIYTVTYEPITVPKPTATAWATSAVAGAATFTADAGLGVKYFTKADTDTTVVDAEYVNTYGTVYVGKGGFDAISGRSPNTAYTVYAIAYNEAAGTYSAEPATATFLTPYRVTVTADENGSATVDGVTATKADPKEVDLYGSKAASDTNYTASGDNKVDIPYAAELTATPTDTDKYAFKAWTVAPTGGGAVTEPTEGKYSYTPEGTSGTITVTATFEKVYTLIFDANGGTGGTLPDPSTITGVKLNVGTTLAGTQKDFSRAGYDRVEQWALNTGGTDTRVGFGGTLTLTNDIVSRVDTNEDQIIYVYHVWKSQTLSVSGNNLLAVYNMDQDDWDGNGAPTDTEAVNVEGGTGPFTYRLVAENPKGTDDPTAFLTINSKGVIELVSGARMGDAGKYYFRVEVTDTGKEDKPTAKSEVITLTVDRAKPQIETFKYTYAGDSNQGDPNAKYGYNGDKVIWDTAHSLAVEHVSLAGTKVVDPYDEKVVLFVINSITPDNTIDAGVWASDATDLNGVDGTVAKPTEDYYDFTFTVEDTTLKNGSVIKANNYYTATEEDVVLAAIERDPDIGVKTDGAEGNYAENATGRLELEFGYVATSHKVSIKNTGNTPFAEITIAEDDDKSNIASNLNPISITTPLGPDDTPAEFTFDIATGMNVGTYTATFKVTGDTKTNAGDDSATYTFTLVVKPAEIDHAELKDLTAPVAGRKPSATVTEVAPSDETMDTSEYYVVPAKNGVVWTDAEGNVLGSDYEFKPGVSYTATITLDPDANHTFVEPGNVEVLETCTGYVLDGIEAGTVASGGADDGNGGKVTYTVNEDGTVTIRHTFAALPLEVSGELVAVDYDTANITKVEAATAVEAHLFYVVLDTAQKDEDITPAMIKAAALTGDLTGFAGSPAIELSGHGSASVVGGTTASLGVPIPVNGLNPGQTYYLYVAAQPQSEYTLGTNIGLGKAESQATLGKQLILQISSTEAEGIVTWTTDTGGDEGTADSTLSSVGSVDGTAGPENLTMTGDDKFTPSVANGYENKYGFSKWTVSVEGKGDVVISASDTSEADRYKVYEYDFDHEDTADITTLTATFFRKINGSFSISNTGTTLAPGETLGIALGADNGSGGKHALYVGAEPQEDTTELFGNSVLTYQWYHDNGTDSDGIESNTSWTLIPGATSATYTIPTGDTHAGHKFKLVITYEDKANGDPIKSSVEAVTEIVKAKLATPEPKLQISEYGQDGDASAAQKLTGGLYLTFPAIKQDDGSGKVQEYIVVLKQGDTVIDNTLKVTPDGKGPYTHYWEALKDTDGDGTPDIVVTPGVTYTVEVQAIAVSTSNYTDSDTGKASAAAGKRTPTPDELKITVKNTVFNGVDQTGASSALTAEEEVLFGKVTFQYAENDKGYAKADSKLHVDLKDQPPADTDDLYHVYVSTAGGTGYLAITDVLLTTTNCKELASDEWKITQAPARFTVTGEKLSTTVNKDYDLTDKSRISDVVVYTTGGATAEYNNGTVTGYYDLEYILTDVPDGSAAYKDNDKVIDPANFKPDAVGPWTITVNAKYNGNADDQYKADVSEATKTVTLEVMDKSLEWIGIVGDDRVATYATPGAGYYDPSTADNAKSMSLAGVTIQMYWDNGTYTNVTLNADGSNLPNGVKFVYNAKGDEGGDINVKNGGVYFTREDTVLITVEYTQGDDTISSAANTTDGLRNIRFTLNPKELTYVTYSEDKTWDGSTDPEDPYGVKLKPDQTYATKADGNAGPDDVWLVTTGVEVAFASSDVGTHNIVITSGTPELKGTDAGFYTLTGEEGQAEITRAVIENPKVTVSEPETGKPFPTDVNVTDDTYGDKTEEHSTVTIVWQEKGPDGDWKDVDPTSTPQPGKEYRPVITLRPDDKHVLDGTIDEEAINGKPNDTDGATITGDENEYVYTIGTEIPGIPVKPVLMFDDVYGSSKLGPKDEVIRTINLTKGVTPSGTIEINLDAYDNTVYDVVVVPEPNQMGEALYTNSLDLSEMKHNDLVKQQTHTVDLSKIDTSTAGKTYMLVLTARGGSVDGMAEKDKDVLAVYRLVIEVNAPYVPTPTPPAEEEVCPVHVFYWVGLHGVTDMPTAETVEEGAKPVAVPTVTANTGYEFKGWSLTKPVEGEEPVLVDPTTVTITEDTVFYAVYEELEVVPTTIFHEHYVIGYPDGTFGPADDITRGSVATIIARAILPNFVEGSDYGNPGGYLDVEGHWAESAIAYCSIYGVFKGYDDGKFYPDKPITRQEFALVIARLNGVQPNQGVPFTDMDDAAFWAMDGIYTSYANGWFNGYLDNTFKPLNNIARSEAVKVFNAYLKRGVDAEGLSDMTEYVHSGTASNNTENGINQYMTWPDVPETYWAYYEIIEAANDHEFHYTGENFDQLPEHWTKCWIDEVWRYHDDPNDGGPAAN